MTRHNVFVVTTTNERTEGRGGEVGRAWLVNKVGREVVLRKLWCVVSKVIGGLFLSSMLAHMPVHVLSFSLSKAVRGLPFTLVPLLTHAASCGASVFSISVQTSVQLSRHDPDPQLLKRPPAPPH